jgi:hypothetical protein
MRRRTVTVRVRPPVWRAVRALAAFRAQSAAGFIEELVEEAVASDPDLARALAGQKADEAKAGEVRS